LILHVILTVKFLPSSTLRFSHLAYTSDAIFGIAALGNMANDSSSSLLSCRSTRIFLALERRWLSLKLSLLSDCGRLLLPLFFFSSLTSSRSFRAPSKRRLEGAVEAASAAEEVTCSICSGREGSRLVSRSPVSSFSAVSFSSIRANRFEV
jgi:hypothetical protein